MGKLQDIRNQLAAGKKNKKKKPYREYLKELANKANREAVNQLDWRKAQIDIKFRQSFYKSSEWKNLRQDFLETQTNRICNYCKKDLSLNLNDSLTLNIDHIKPIKFFWNQRLNINNLQILCNECNKVKANNYSTGIKKEVKIKIYKLRKPIKKEIPFTPESILIKKEDLK